MTFENEAFSAHMMKRSFICNLWLWGNVYSRDRNRSLLDFFDFDGL